MTLWTCAMITAFGNRPHLEDVHPMKNTSMNELTLFFAIKKLSIVARHGRQVLKAIAEILSGAEKIAIQRRTSFASQQKHAFPKVVIETKLVIKIIFLK